MQCKQETGCSILTHLAGHDLWVGLHGCMSGCGSVYELLHARQKIPLEMCVLEIDQYPHTCLPCVDLGRGSDLR